MSFLEPMSFLEIKYQSQWVILVPNEHLNLFCKPFQCLGVIWMGSARGAVVRLGLMGQCWLLENCRP